MFKRLVKSSRKNIFYPIKNEEYRIFFEKNYLNDWVKTQCLCEGENNKEIISIKTPFFWRLKQRFKLRKYKIDKH